MCPNNSIFIWKEIYQILKLAYNLGNSSIHYRLGSPSGGVRLIILVMLMFSKICIGASCKIREVQLYLLTSIVQFNLNRTEPKLEVSVQFQKKILAYFLTLPSERAIKTCASLRLGIAWLKGQLNLSGSQD